MTTSDQTKNINATEVLDYFRGAEGFTVYTEAIFAARSTGFFALVGFNSTPEGIPDVLLSANRVTCEHVMMSVGKAWTRGSQSMNIVEGATADMEARSLIQAARDIAAPELPQDALVKIDKVLERWEV